MREILFRGKRVDNGEWIYGVPITDKATGDAYIITSTAGASLKSEINNMCATGFRIIRNTIGQYTGLTDKNGTRIFEGDIVRTDDNLKGVVEWDETFAKCIVCYNQISGNWFDFEGEGGYPVSLECEIIGNIHDNPESLKGE